VTTARAGEKYHCTDPACRSEVALAVGSASTSSSQQIVCSCGARMAKGWRRPVWLPSLRRSIRVRVR
jgi:hypothetical protein